MKTLDKNLKLYNGVMMPQFGLGTCGITQSEEIDTALNVALQSGYRLIDTADVYNNQAQLATYFKNHFVSWESLFITSKVWNADHRYRDAVKKIDTILHDLNLKYLDLMLVHWPTKHADECYRALREAYQSKKIRAVGVSNFTVPQLRYFCKHFPIQPMVNQVELHPGLNRLDVVEYCREKGIAVTSWQTIGRGKCLVLPTIVDLAKKHRTYPANICLKWAMQQGIAVIPKSVHPSWIKSNAELDSLVLEPSDMKAINDLPQGTFAWDVPDVEPNVIPWIK